MEGTSKPQTPLGQDLRPPPVPEVADGRQQAAQVVAFGVIANRQHIEILSWIVELNQGLDVQDDLRPEGCHHIKKRTDVSTDLLETVRGEHRSAAGAGQRCRLETLTAPQ